MRHNVIYLLGALAILASCAKEVEKTEEPVVPAGKEQVTIIAQTPQTRTTAEVDGTNVIFSWQENETIAVVEQNATAATPFTVSNRETGAFEGTKTAGNNLLFAVSPAQDLTAAATASTITSYTITLPATYENYVPGTTNAVMIGTQNGEASGDVYPFRFAHAAALVKVTYVNVPVGTKKLGFTADKNINGSFSFNTTTGVTIETPNEGSTTTWLELAEAVTTPNQTMDFYIPVPAATYGQFNIALYKVEGSEDVVIAETKKKKSSSTTLAVGDVFVTPTVTYVAPVTKIYYEKVTAALSDWSGQYLIVDEGNGIAANGSWNAVKGIKSSDVTIVDSKIESTQTVDAYAVTISNVSGNNYSVYFASTKLYVGYTGSSNECRSYDSLYSNNTNWTISISDGKAILTNVYADTRVLRSNFGSADNQVSADNGPFRCYTGSTGNPAVLYKLDDGKSNAEIAWKNASNQKATFGSGTISFGSPNVTVGAPTFDNPNDISTSEITFSSSKAGVATVNAGVVTIVGAGETTIKAEFAGNDSYRSATATYVLTVTDITPYTINKSASNGSIVTKVENVDVTTAKAGDVVTVEAIADDNYEFTGWSVKKTANEEHIETEGNTFVMPAEAVTVSANFVPTYAITISFDSEKATSVVAKVGGSVVTRAKEGDSVTIEATAKTGFAVSSITSTDVEITDGHFSMPAHAVTVNATFDVAVAKTNQMLFHETFGDNSNSARAWDDSYSVKSGVSGVYSGITSYTVSNVKQGKNTTGSTQSGLNQSNQGTDASIIIGPLSVANAENMILTYQWNAGSIKGTYSTTVYYKTTSNGSFTEVTGTGSGATSFVTRTYNLPKAAQVSTLYLMIVWNTSNTSAIIDEVNLQGDYPPPPSNISQVSDKLWNTLQ